MDVGNRHEDRNLQHLLAEVFIFADHLGHHHAAVAGSEHQVGIVDAHAPRFAEERHDEKPEQQQEYRAAPQKRSCRVADQQPVEQPPNQEADQPRDEDDFVTFLIDFHGIREGLADK